MTCSESIQDYVFLEAAGICPELLGNFFQPFQVPDRDFSQKAFYPYQCILRSLQDMSPQSDGWIQSVLACYRRAV